MAGELQPLDQQFPIVGPDGRPSLYFIQWAQQRQIDIGTALTLQDLMDFLTAHALQEGSGISLTPDGDLNNSPSIGIRNGVGLNFDAMHNLKLADTAVVPGTYGDATHVAQITVDQQGRITGVALVPISGGGGSGLPWYFKPPLAANFSTMYASFRGGNIANAFTVADDAQVGMSYFDGSTDVGYLKAMGRPIPLANRGPGTTFTITAHLMFNSFTGNDQMGIWVRANANQYVFLDLFNRGGSMNLQRAFYNSAWNDGSFNLSWENNEVWLRIAVSNQTLNYWVSMDGKNWTQIYTVNENLFAAAYTDYGFCGGRFSTTAKWFITCDHLTSDEYP